MKIGLLKETKNPPDRRVPLTPAQAAELQMQFPGTEVYAQKSEIRCFSDQEFENAGIPVTGTLEHCDVLLGVKEVAKDTFLPGKTYVFFSHTGKKQPYNRDMLKEMAALGTTLIDYEYLSDQKGQRLVAFGRWAGIVGAYNGIRAWGLRTHAFVLDAAHECRDLADLFSRLATLRLPPLSILITGGGRVAHGAMETLKQLKILQVTAGDYLTRDFNRPVMCQIDPDDYVRRRGGGGGGGGEFKLGHFYSNPEQYESTFLRYAFVTDLFIPCHYWDPRSPAFLLPDDYLHPEFRIKIIADVSCDVRGPIPSTLRASTIAEPFYGYDPESGQETSPFNEKCITVMAVDNLPGELPRDASEDFGQTLLKHFFPALLEADSQKIIERATILNKGKLTPGFEYLMTYLDMID